MIEEKYKGYPDGYNALVRDMIPWYLRPFKKMLMKLYLKIVAEG